MSHASDADYERLERERRFHDELASKMQASELPPASLSPLDAAMLSETQIRAGTRVLDLGCGTGDLTLHLLDTGAEVFALDLSPGMIEVARKRIELFGNGATATFVAASAAQTGLADEQFDVVVGRFVLHHVDLASAAPEIARILRPGGQAVFAENSGRNPVLMFGRRHVAGRFGIPRLGTEDEHPLTNEDISRLTPAFANVALRYPVFEFFTIFDRQVLRFRWPSLSRVLRFVDRAIGRVPPLARHSFRVVIVATR